MLSQTRDWLSVAEASRVLGVHPDTLRRWADAGDIPVFVTPGNQRRFERRAIWRLTRAPDVTFGAAERLVRDYCLSADRATRTRLLRLAGSQGAAMGREARAMDRSLAESIAAILGVRRRVIDALGEGATRDVNVAVDRIVVGLAADHSIAAGTRVRPSTA